MSDDLDVNKQELDTIDVDTSLDAAVDPAPMTEKPLIPDPSRGKKKKIIILISILVVLLLIGGFAYWWLVMKPVPVGDSVTDTPAETEAAVDTRDYAKELIDKIRTAEAGLKTTYPKMAITDDEPHSPAYQPTGEKYYITGKIGHAITVSDDGQSDPSTGFNAATEAAAVAVLDADETLISAETEFTVRYQSDKVICSINHASYPFNATCANVRDYTSVANEINPFADAFVKEPDNAQYIENTLFGTPQITKGQDGYQNAVVAIGAFEGVGGYAGLYYGTTDWTFWRGTQSIISCEDYNTVALQKAFVGESCYEDGDDNAKVEVTL